MVSSIQFTGTSMNKFDLLKSHVEAFTRKDGTVVQAHDDKRTPAAKTKNEGHGFHGEAHDGFLRAKHGPDDYYRKSTESDHIAATQHADKAFAAAADHLVSNGHFADHDQASEFLDAREGRHLHDETGGDVSKSKWLPGMVKKFKRENQK